MYLFWGSICGLYHYNRKVFWVHFLSSIAFMAVTIISLLLNIVPATFANALAYLFAPILLAIYARGAVLARRLNTTEANKQLGGLEEVFE